MQKEEATQIIERLRGHQQRLSPRSEIGAVVHEYCSFLESVLDDIMRGHITGPPESTGGVVDSARKICDYLDGMSEAAWAGLESTSTPKQ